MSGKLASDNGPEARMTLRARNRLRFFVVAVHTPEASSKTKRWRVVEIVERAK